MELEFVHENGCLDSDGASDTSEESDEDEAGWERVEFSSSGAGKYSTLWDCALPVEKTWPNMEKVSFHLHIGI